MADEKPQSVQSEPKRRHEVADVHEDMILRVGGVLVITLVIVAVAIYGLIHLFGVHQRAVAPPSAPMHEVQGNVPPLTQSAPGQNAESVRAEKEAVLNGYGWVDREKGVVRIPIERAMELMGERRMRNESRQER